jgi:hypothetical protein
MRGGSERIALVPSGSAYELFTLSAVPDLAAHSRELSATAQPFTTQSEVPKRQANLEQHAFSSTLWRV